ncbi:hypothetical protein FBU30_002868, partial [Linnemannia zychae]
FPRTSTCTGARVSYKLVRQALFDKQPKSFRKDSNVEKSVELWLKEIQEEGGKTMILKKQYGNPYSFVIAWSTSFQLQVMADNTHIVCMDSTHKVVKSIYPAKDGPHQYPSAFLFALLVKDQVCKKGIWERHLKSMSVKESRIMRPRLHAIRKANTADEQQHLWQQFQSDFPSAQKLLKYFQGWFSVEELPKWAAFHRE